MGDHMPVHLGSMPMSVQVAVAAITFAPGDIAILNDPFAGGTHLPDITMVLPIFLPGPEQAASMFRLAPTMRTWAECLPDRWDPPRKSFKRAFAFHPYGLCEVAASIARC